MQVLKTFKPYEGCTVELVDTDDKYEIRVNGKVKAIEYDYTRACETFNSFKN